MIAGWMLHVLVVSALLALGARAAEAAARLYGAPARWAWAGSMAGSVLLPAAAALHGGGGGGWSVIPTAAPSLPAGDAAGAGAATGTVHWWEGAAAWIREASRLPQLGLPADVDGFLLAAWALASAALASALALGWLRWRQARRWWPERRIQGTAVRVSRDTGPAVVGIVRPFIVLPAWLLDRQPGELRLAVGHEREHLRARDPALLAAGLAVLCLTPWNPVSWWQLRRLKLAVEVDCDGRILGAGASRRRYGDFLIDIAGGGRRLPLFAAPLGRRRSMLEGRIRTMTRTTPPFRAARAVLMALLAGGALLAACDAPPPTGDGATNGQEASARAVGDEEVSWDTAPDSVVFRDGRAWIEVEAGPGLQGATFGITGNSSLEADPLVILDGRRVGGPGSVGAGGGVASGPSADLAGLGLAPDDIESIEVLKGDTATALYGPDARQGVVLVTTKGGAGG